jgi:hypothetical protein
VAAVFFLLVGWPKLVGGIALILWADFWLVGRFIPRNIPLRNWIIERGTAFIAVALMATLGAAAILWLIVNFVWATDDALSTAGETTFTAGSDVVYVSADYPQVALADAVDNKLRLHFAPAAAGAALPDASLTARIQPAAGLTLPDAPGLAVSMDIGPGRPSSRSIEMVNDQSLGGWRDEGVVEIELFDDTGQALGAPISLPVIVEGERGFAVRRFVTSTIDEASPLIFLLLLVLPGLAAFIQKMIDQRFAELKESRRKDFESLVQEFRDRLLIQDKQGAETVWRRMNESQYKDFGSDDKELTRLMLVFSGWQDPEADIQLSNDDKWQGRILEMGIRWRREFVIACVLANEKLKNLTKDKIDKDSATKTEIDEKYSSFQLTVEKAKDLVLSWDFPDRPDLQMNLLHLRHDNTGYQVQQRRIIPATHGFADSSNSYVITENSLKWAFDRDDASNPEETRFLKEGLAFWPRHPMLTRELSTLSRHVLVHGPFGSGRTALASVLPHQTANYPSDLFVRYDRTKGLHCAIAEGLLWFILEHPLFLGRYDHGRRGLLADFLASNIEINTIVNNIETVQKNIHQVHDLSTLRVHAGEVMQLTERQRDARERLELLKKAVLANRQTYHHKQRGANSLYFLQCTRVLEYKRVVIVIQENNDELRRLRRDVLTQLDNWQAEGIYMCLFAKDETLANETAIPESVARCQMGWSKTNLQQMAEWRFERYLQISQLDNNARRYQKLPACFDNQEEGLEALLETSRIGGGVDDYNPGKFMRLWRELFGTRKVGEIPVAKHELQSFLDRQEKLSKLS